MEEHRVTRRTVVVGAAWSVPVLAVAVATAGATASEGVTFWSFFEQVGVSDATFHATYTVSSTGAPAEPNSTTVTITYNGQAVTITPPVGWVVVGTPGVNSAVYAFAGVPEAGLEYVFTIDVAYDESLQPQVLDGTIASGTAHDDDSLDLQLGVAGYWGPITEFEGDYYAVYFVQNVGSTIEPGGIVVNFEFPAGADASFITGETTGFAQSDPAQATTTEELTYFQGAYVPIKLTSATGLSGLLRASVAYAGIPIARVDEVDVATVVPAVTTDQAWGPVNTSPQTFGPITGFGSTFTFGSNTLAVPEARTLMVEFAFEKGIVDQYSDILPFDWIFVRSGETASSYYATYLIISDTPESVLWAVSATTPADQGLTIARPSISGRGLGDYPVDLLGG